MKIQEKFSNLTYFFLIMPNCTLTEQARREGLRSASSMARDISTTINKWRICSWKTWLLLKHFKGFNNLLPKIFRHFILVIWVKGLCSYHPKSNIPTSSHDSIWKCKHTVIKIIDINVNSSYLQQKRATLLK